MSPEQVLGSKEVDHRADLWALGVVAYRAITGEVPFKGTTPHALIFAICKGEYPLPSERGAPAALDEWFASVLCPAVDDRINSAEQLVQQYELASPSSAVPADVGYTISQRTELLAMGDWLAAPEAPDHPADTSEQSPVEIADDETIETLVDERPRSDAPVGWQPTVRAEPPHAPEPVYGPESVTLDQDSSLDEVPTLIDEVSIDLDDDGIPTAVAPPAELANGSADVSLDPKPGAAPIEDEPTHRSASGLSEPPVPETHGKHELPSEPPRFDAVGPSEPPRFDAVGPSEPPPSTTGPIERALRAARGQSSPESQRSPRLRKGRRWSYLLVTLLAVGAVMVAIKLVGEGGSPAPTNDRGQSVRGATADPLTQPATTTSVAATPTGSASDGVEASTATTTETTAPPVVSGPPAVVPTPPLGSSAPVPPGPSGSTPLAKPRPTATPRPSVTVQPSATPSPSAKSTPTPAPTPAPTPSPSTGKPKPKPTSSKPKFATEL